MRGRDWWLPLIVATAVVAYVGYLWFQGRDHSVQFAITGSDIRFVDVDDPSISDQLREESPSPRLMLVEVSWEAAEAIESGAYYVLASPPVGWSNYACEPECDWGSSADVAQFADALKRRTFAEGAKFDADEAGSVQVTFVPPPLVTEEPESFEPAAWLVQTDGENVLGGKRILWTGG
jgi:hypothetical protein